MGSNVGKYTVRPMDPSWEIYIFFLVHQNWPIFYRGKTQVHEAVAVAVGGSKHQLSHPMINANFGDYPRTWIRG